MKTLSQKAIEHIIMSGIALFDVVLVVVMTIYK
jgi:hypothetical protein